MIYVYHHYFQNLLLGLVPLNGDIYRHENNTWIPVEANIKLNHQRFIDNFNIEADEELRFIPQGQSAHDLMYTDQVNVIAELTSATPAIQ